VEKVLIGITSKNRCKILPQAIESGLKQTYPYKEIAVFDDNSTDGTEQLKEKYPTVTWYLSKEDKGYVYARNMFLETTDADYYCSLDDDSWFLNTTHLQQAVDYMNASPGVAVLAFNIFSPDTTQGVFKSKDIVQTNNFIGCGHMLRVAAVKSVGNYAVNPGYYGGEEKDLCIKLIDKGYAIMRFPAIEIWHDKTNVARDIFRQHRSGVCNDLVFMWRRTPFIYLVPSFFRKIYVHLTFPIRYKNSALYKPMLKGVMDFAGGVFSGKVKRDPVSKKGLMKYLSFNK
jgi:glycosyltransferase involved in cell wall biosynthesis